MPRNARLLFFLVLSICLLQLPTYAQDASALKQSTAARAPSVAALISSRVVREGQNGFLAMVATQPTDQARQIMSDENRDRIAIFKLIASQTSETPEQVAALYAQRAMKLNPQPLKDGAQPPPPPPVTPMTAESCTDLQFAKSLKERFAVDEDLKAYDIQVDVANKTVILSGSLSSDLERTRAAEIVQSSGCPVASLVNDLSIGVSDNALTALIKRAYGSDSELRTQHVKVEVSQGNVVLSGSVSENIMRTIAASKASAVHGVKTVTNNIQVVPVLKNSKHASGEGEGISTQPSANSEAHRATLSGAWTGTFTSCAQGQSDVHVNITESAPDDITADIEIEVPGSAPGTFTTHGVLNTMNNFLSFQFSGWQHQPPGLIMGNIGGYVTITDQGPTGFSGIIRAPGCGHISLKRR